MISKTYREALQGAFSLLTEAGQNPKIAEWLCLHLCGCSRQEWLEKLDSPISAQDEAVLTSWLERVLDGEPYQYIIGVQDFYGREFHVSPAVLIPRPETEELVEQVLKQLKEIWPETHQIKGVDVGTGSGAIAITLDLEENQRLQMLAVDISSAALEVAKANANRHQARVSFQHSDLLQALLSSGEKVDFIVSNPPYIPFAEREKLDRNVVDFEPHLALFAQEDGLYFYRQIIKQASLVLNSPGLLAFEVGQGQAESVLALLQETFPQANCAIKRDLSAIERIVLAIV